LHTKSMWHSQHNDSDLYLIWHALMNETHVWWYNHA